MVSAAVIKISARMHVLVATELLEFRGGIDGLTEFL